MEIPIVEEPVSIYIKGYENIDDENIEDTEDNESENTNN